MAPIIRLATAIAIALVCCTSYVQSCCGGLGPEIPVWFPSPHRVKVQTVLASVGDQIQDKFPGGYRRLQPLSYRTQLVAGHNYFIRARVFGKDGKKSYAHLRIYEPLEGPNELSDIKTNVDRRSPLNYF